jgi:predicted site-specific integrase-resolvase
MALQRLTHRDLDAIRSIVREEIKRALESSSKQERDEEEVKEFEDLLAFMRSPEWKAHHEELARKRAVRAALPIPDGPFVDIYDARRLLKPTRVTANAWIKRGRLKRLKVDGRIQISRSEIDAILAEYKRRRG